MTESSAGGWSAYLRDYHHSHPGITETVLAESGRADVGTPYEWLVAAVPSRPGQVIDVACGSAPMQTHLPSAASYLGVDVSQAELDLAGRLGRGPVLRGDANDLPVADASADVVICSMAVMLLHPVERALAEVARVLRPGGMLATIRPVGLPARPRDLRIAVPLLVGLRHLPEMPQRFGSRRFASLLKAAGLSVTDDRALRFAHPLRDERDARLVVEALYLPHVTDDRRAEAARRLAGHAGPLAEVPLAIRRTVAVKR